MFVGPVCWLMLSLLPVAVVLLIKITDIDTFRKAVARTHIAYSI